ncbi:EAL domain-containing protein [Clostridium estertheticum]|uniref:EAL domain-containing protein n=1 Tax=Clostridium estertheticum TaxID=238834 RepID=UPI001C7DED06|nr:EAL domain-containing protein [Clostridium estertheticum]MBX4266351.1 EAL domain-containing protein [Clostridium estertheticum]MBX4268246.1 EAL domain-containing protein [Clostridium estertheticum]WLC79837.1 EAL domain-containing protein [Clostridium estertheticum]WLC86943.1 EAL domain-containing protein [Clostridium estertheticum]
MKLSAKLFKIVLLVSLILICFLYIISKSFLLKSFTDMEIDKAFKDTNVVLNYIQNDLNNINDVNLDYSRWDETYNYMNNRNNKYIEDNFDDASSIVGAKINFIFITDNQGNIIYKKNTKEDTKEMFTLAFAKNITSNIAKLLSNNNIKNVKGTFLYGKYPILISAQRITKGGGLGHSPGFLIFAKYYDKEEMDTLNQNTGIKTEIAYYDKGLILNNDFIRKNEFVKVSNEKIISSYGLINDIFLKPSFFVKITSERNVSKKAQNTMDFYFLIVLVALIIFSLSIFILIHVFVVRKIKIINSVVENVHNSYDVFPSIILKGNDEISELGFKFNDMFQRLKKSDETIVSLANYDTLTGLTNRKKLLENIRDLLKNKNEKLAVFFITLDKFKAINETFGHQVGDIVLAKVAERLENNIAKSRDIVSRIGGDEFIVIIRNLISAAGAIEIAGEIVKTLSGAYIYNEESLYIGASVGISLFPQHGNDVDTLIRNADLAMYEVKNSGGRGYRLYNNIMNYNNNRMLELEKNLKSAMERNEFITYYQPIIDLKLMEVLSAESLIRWKCGDKVIQPIEFIPIAKKTGKMVEIDNWMLHNACVQCKKWQNSGSKNFSISVNTSYKQLIQANFVQLVMNICRSQSLDPKYLNLEITEDEAMEDINLIIKVLLELKSYGIKISMDDFGTGYSSLSWLSKLPIDTIKIDKSLIIDLDNNSKNIVIIKAIIAVADSLDIKVIAEGIETETEFLTLKELGCQYIQGYLIGKPMMAPDFYKEFIK